MKVSAMRKSISFYCPSGGNGRRTFPSRSIRSGKYPDHLRAEEGSCSFRDVRRARSHMSLTNSGQSSSRPGKQDAAARSPSACRRQLAALDLRSRSLHTPELNPLTRNQRPAHLINDNEITSNAVINIFQPMLFQPFNELLNVTRHHETNAHKLIIRAHRLIPAGHSAQTFPDLRSGAKQGVSSNDDGDCFLQAQPLFSRDPNSSSWCHIFGEPAFHCSSSVRFGDAEVHGPIPDFFASPNAPPRPCA